MCRKAGQAEWEEKEASSVWGWRQQQAFGGPISETAHAPPSHVTQSFPLYYGHDSVPSITISPDKPFGYSYVYGRILHAQITEKPLKYDYLNN